MLQAAIDHSEKIESLEHFKQWVRDDLRRVIPHEAFVCGLGRMHAAGAALDYVIPVDFPVDCLAAIRNTAGGLESPLLRRWMMCREPLVFDVAAASQWPEASPEWLQQFCREDLRNAAVHGVIDAEQHLGTYFSFYRLPETPGEHEHGLLLKLAPVVHATLVRVIQRIEYLAKQKRPDWSRLTQREMEVVEWVGRGFSNFSIAEGMGLSENTVKHHLSSIFDKTCLSSRSVLMSVLALHPPGLIAKGTTVL